MTFESQVSAFSFADKIWPSISKSFLNLSSSASYTTRYIISNSDPCKAMSKCDIEINIKRTYSLCCVLCSPETSRTLLIHLCSGRNSICNIIFNQIQSHRAKQTGKKKDGTSTYSQIKNLPRTY